MKLFKNLNFDKLRDGLSKTREKIVNKLTETISGKAKLPAEILEELEEILVTSDIGFDTAIQIIDEVKIKLKSESDRSEENILRTIKASLVAVLEKSNSYNEFLPDIEKYKPFIILIVGVNGAGKTTTIGKLAYNFKKSGLSVIVGAADTFRAAANEQLEIWAKRAGVEIVQKKNGTDPSSVAFETVAKAIKENIDVVMIDTAGRLHNKSNLMEELNKITRVIQKQSNNAPQETFLVLDGNTGQNAVLQAEEFSKVANLTGLVITKLDGTAKGGVVFQICSKQCLPVRYIGVGEDIEDLQSFEANAFVDAIFSTK
ncbi:MAG: signal recognition particle-docking protein FtsY [Ignavibacteria bacterium]|nr:signal recognition particle-docking protein FtsY [Ignavibacteria bacterium]MDP3831726.1 signal recognition particle-docking protein FtsY [Ignavibacteriaceae bacterium]